MSLTPELEQQIQQEMTALNKGDYLRPGIAYDDFSGEFSTLLAQAKEDLTLLEQAGFDGSMLPKMYGYLEQLTKAHGARIVAEADEQEVRKAFNQSMPKAKADKKLLMAVGRYIVARTDDAKNKRVLELVRAGSGNLDTLNDNVTLAGFIRKHKDLAQEVKPGGTTVDEAYINQVETSALNLLKLRGETLTADDETKEQVDNQRRLITLCIQAQREIKLFAEMAFYNDTDYYNKYYASDAIRKKRKNQASGENQQSTD